MKFDDFYSMIKMWFYGFYYNSNKIELLRGVHHVDPPMHARYSEDLLKGTIDPPKHTILNMVYCLQELKTIILEKSVFPVIAFCFFEDVSSKTPSLRFDVFRKNMCFSLRDKIETEKNERWESKKSISENKTKIQKSS